MDDDDAVPATSDAAVRLAAACERTRREATAAQSAQAKVAGVRPDAQADRMLRAGASARTQLQRVQWLQRWGSAHVAPLAQVAACRPGCAHCCHLSAAITSSEARLIGQAVRRAPVVPRAAMTLAQAVGDLEQARALTSRHMGTPCPFLSADQRCSIYEHRPFVCRTHLSLADDAWLCSNEAGPDAAVPRADMRTAVALFLSADPTATLADIRDFFPK